MGFRIIKTLLFILLLSNQNIRRNKSIIILILSIIIQNIAILLIISTKVDRLALDLAIVLTTIVFCIDLVYIAIKGILNYLAK